MQSTTQTWQWKSLEMKSTHPCYMFWYSASCHIPSSLFEIFHFSFERCIWYYTILPISFTKLSYLLLISKLRLHLITLFHRKNVRFQEQATGFFHRTSARVSSRIHPIWRRWRQSLCFLLEANLYTTVFHQILYFCFGFLLSDFYRLS